MKKLASLLLVAILAVALTGCQGDSGKLDNSTPRGAVELFVYCLTEEPDINTAYAVCELWQGLSDSEVNARFRLYNMYFFILQNISISKAQISGNSAEVILTAKDEGRNVRFVFGLEKRTDYWTITSIDAPQMGYGF